MAQWTHRICERCWFDRNPGRRPAFIRETQIETCCFCGKPTISGIYVREDPKKIKFCSNPEDK